MTMYLTSDLHFGHKLVSEIRGFESTDEHDSALMTEIMDVMTDVDHLWILGDISVSKRAEEYALGLLAEVPGVLHLVCGNHDSVSAIHRDGWKRQKRFMEVFASVQEFARRRGPDGVDVLMSHYPYAGDLADADRYMQYRLRDEGAWLVHGHTHDSSGGLRSGATMLHVGWDAHWGLVKWSDIENEIRNGKSPQAYRIDELIGLEEDWEV